MEGEDILSVIFLALICIVIAGIVRKVTPDGMQIPTFALMAVCLWVAYDYMTMQRYKAKLACKSKNKSNDTSDEDKIKKLISELSKDSSVSSSIQNDTEASGDEMTDNVDEANPSDDEASEEASSNNKQHTSQLKELSPVQKHYNEYDIGIYNGQTLQDLHMMVGGTGDTKIANRMKYMALQPKLSQDIRAAVNVAKQRHWFEEELQEQEARDWWDAEQDYLDAFM